MLLKNNAKTKEMWFSLSSGTSLKNTIWGQVKQAAWTLGTYIILRLSRSF